VHLRLSKSTPDRVSKIPNLPNQRWLRGVQTAFGRDRQASRLGDVDDVPKVPQFHDSSTMSLLLGHAFKACHPAY
jgi:hypothetical protein